MEEDEVSAEADVQADILVEAHFTLCRVGR
jgi:hypothetical protein